MLRNGLFMLLGGLLVLAGRLLLPDAIGQGEREITAFDTIVCKQIFVVEDASKLEVEGYKGVHINPERLLISYPYEGLAEYRYNLATIAAKGGKQIALKPR